MRTEPHVSRRRVRLLGVVFAAVMVAISSATPAWAHGGDESQEGYLLVQQALAHLAHDSGHTGVMDAMEKVDDALAAKDHDGVNLAELNQAMMALEADHVVRARALLQHCISEAVSELKPAVAEETGTSVVMLPVRGRGALNGGDWGFLTGSAVALLAGLALAARFRPARRLRALAGEPEPAGEVDA